MKKISLLIFLASLSHHLVIACSCFIINNFCEAALLSIQWNSENTQIVRATVKSEIIINEWQRDLIFTVQEKYYGHETPGEIYVIDGSGADCTRNLDPYHVGDELIFISHSFIDEDQRMMARISNCIPPPLRVNGKQVSGNIQSEKSSTMSLDKFIALNNCISGLGLTLFPNPADQVLTIKSLSTEIKLDKLSRLDLIDSYGRKVFEYITTPDDKNLNSLDISVEHLPSGIYHALLYGEDRKQIIKVLVL